MKKELAKVYFPIQKELKMVQKRLSDVLTQSSHAQVQEIGAYIAKNPGKFFRSALLILSYYAACEQEEVDSKARLDDAIDVAVGIECIHLASLLHDDIIDDAEIRRGKPSVFAKWGTHVALVSGVYFYSIALECLTKVGNLPVLDTISRSVKHLCEGEYHQLFDRGQFPNLDDYMEMVRKKTAVLFGASCFAGAALAGSGQLKQDFWTFGETLGVLFQLTDDYLDLFGDASQLGKPPGQDIVAGERTFPLIVLYQSLDAQAQQILEDRLLKHDIALIEELRGQHAGFINQEMQRLVSDQFQRVQSLEQSISTSKYWKSLLYVGETIAKRWEAVAV